jgi:hypothetical protein
MEVIFGLVGIAVVIFAVYQILEANEDRQREKEKARAYVARMQAAQARSVAAEYERQRAPRSAPVTTGVSRSGSTPVKAEVKRHDNSFDEVVDTYTAPTYSSSHSTSSYSSGSCSSSSSYSSSDSSSSSSSSSSSCD